MSVKGATEDIWWLIIIKAMLDEFPKLKEKTLEYLQTRNPEWDSFSIDDSFRQLSLSSFLN